MQLQIMETKGLLEVPYVCDHCGGRSSDIETLENHIRNEHQKHGRVIKIEPKSSDDEDSEDGVRQMLLNDMVEVQIKEEGEFISPLDLSRKDPLGHEVWIKEEPPEECNIMEGEEMPSFPRIKVPSNLLKPPVAPATPVILNFPLVPGARIPPVLYPFNHRGSQRPNNSVKQARPVPLLVPMIPPGMMVPPPPRPRMPSTFPKAPYLITVPYTCYHCGGRSPDLDSLKTHIMAMHNPDTIHQQKCAAAAKRKLLQNYLNSVKIKIPKPPKPPKIPKEKKIKEAKPVKKPEVVEKPVKPPPVIIKVPKPPVKSEATEKKLKEKVRNWRYYCPFCPFGGDSFRGLILHAKNKHEGERAHKRKEEALSTGNTGYANWLYCLFCDYKSKSKPALKKHTNAIHAKQKNHKCPYCDHSSAYPENLKWHVMKHKYQCPHCDYRSTSRSDLLRHEENNCMILPKGEAKLNCPSPKAPTAATVDPGSSSDPVSTACQTMDTAEDLPSPSSPGNCGLSSTLETTAGSVQANGGDDESFSDTRQSPQHNKNNSKVRDKGKQSETEDDSDSSGDESAVSESDKNLHNQPVVGSNIKVEKNVEPSCSEDEENDVSMNSDIDISVKVEVS